MAKRKSIKGRGADIFLDTEHHNAGTTGSQKPVNTAKQVKVTYFIESQTTDRLEDVWLNLRSKFKGSKISKSKIVEIALNDLIENWKKDQEKSRIEKYLGSGNK